MRVDHLVMHERNLPTIGAGHAAARATTAFVTCLALGSLLTASAADAHVKWFVACNVSDNPLPLQSIFTPTFWLFAALFVVLFYLACVLERTMIGALLARLLDRCTKPLHDRTEELLRAVAAVSFALLWADGGLILTPELKASSAWLSAIQLLIPAYLFTRATLPAAGAGILVLYGYGAAVYGPFHMLDYPLFLGLGGYFVLSVSQNRKLLAARFDVLRWTVALSLLWPSIEKFVYPAWVAPIAAAHPELTLGFDVATVITAAGVVEFGLAFALFWTPLVRRLAALALASLLIAATFDFGKLDGIGHMMIITILLTVLADPGRQPVHCRPARAPFVSSAALLATIFLYTGVHALYYDSWTAALAPLTAGGVLLVTVFLCLRGLGHTLFPAAAPTMPAHRELRLVS
jgi:hypothetical protein